MGSIRASTVLGIGKQPPASHELVVLDLDW